MGEESEVEYSEDIRQGELPDGGEAVEDILTATDPATGDQVVDDVVVTTEPDGSATVSETVFAVDGETGAADVVADAEEEIDPA